MLMLRSAVWVFASLSLSVLLWAKAPTILVEVKGAGLTSPIEITSPEALRKYTFSPGPGPYGGSYDPGSIIDWKSGFVFAPDSWGMARFPDGRCLQPPSRREHYAVFFYWPSRSRPQCFTEKPCLVYVLFYDYDPSSKRGFVYLPGKGEQWHGLDINVVYHGVEGHWFKATDSWTGFVRALIAKRSDRSR